MKLFHDHKLPNPILLLPFLLLATPIAGQEACVKSCTQNSGINQCRGDIPHDQAAWDALDAPIHDCYCRSAVNFSGCRPNCTLDGLPDNIVGRVMGVWEFVNPVCKEAVEAVSKTVESQGVKTGSPEFTAILAEAFHTDVSSSVAPAATGAGSTLEAGETGIVRGANMSINGTGRGADGMPPPPPTSTATIATQHDANKGQTVTIAISVSLSTSFFLAIAFIFWSWARRKRHMLPDQESPNADWDGLPGDNRITVEDPKTQGIKRWVAEQERIKHLGIKMDPDTASETTSTAYTMWTDTDLVPTEVGDHERELPPMPPIREEDGESSGTGATVRGGV